MNERTPQNVETSLTSEAADTLRDLIIHGELAPGERIVERTICRRLNVSRTPLREALKLLEQDGLVEMSRHRGARVAPYSPADALDLFAVIANLESLAAELAADRIDDGELDRLHDLHEQMRGHFEARRVDEYFVLNSRIHDLILAHCGNHVLQSSHARLMLQARRGRYMAIVDGARWKQAMAEHELLLAALRSRQAVVAGQIWRTHLLNTGKTVAAALTAAADAPVPARVGKALESVRS